MWDALMELRTFMFARVYARDWAADDAKKAMHIVTALVRHYTDHPSQLPNEYLEITYREGTQRCVSSLKLGQVRVTGHPRIGSVSSGLAGAIEGLHSQVIDEAAQHLGQLENMDTGSAVDVGRVFAGEQINAHDVVLPTVATRVTHSIRNHGDRNRNETV